MGLSNEFCVHTVLFLVMWTFNQLFTEMCDVKIIGNYILDCAINSWISHSVIGVAVFEISVKQTEQAKAFRVEVYEPILLQVSTHVVG